MSFNSLYQYAWNAFLPHLTVSLNASLPEIQFAFTLFTIFSTSFQIIGGNIADSKGPKYIGLFSSILSAIGFIGTSFSTNVYQLYLFWSIGSIGEGVLYGISANLAVKWFKKSRGFATGFISLGFGLGSAIVNPFIYSFPNYRLVMLLIGLVELSLFPLLLHFIDYPKEEKGQKPKDVVKTGRWWLIYFSFVLGAVPLIIYSSSLSIVARSNVIFLISIFPLLSGISRPLLGYFSDIIGRVQALFITLFMIIIGSFLFSVGIILPSVILIGFFGGSLITLYFSYVGDLFGEKFATSNNAILYTGKAVSGFLGGFFFSYLLETYPIIAKDFGLISVTVALILLPFAKRKPSINLK